MATYNINFPWLTGTVTLNDATEAAMQSIATDAEKTAQQIIEEQLQGTAKQIKQWIADRARTKIAALSELGNEAEALAALEALEG